MLPMGGGPIPALELCQNSPDGLIVGRVGVRLSWEAGSVEETVSDLADVWYPSLGRRP